MSEAASSKRKRVGEKAGISLSWKYFLLRRTSLLSLRWLRLHPSETKGWPLHAYCVSGTMTHSCLLGVFRENVAKILQSIGCKRNPKPHPLPPLLILVNVSLGFWGYLFKWFRLRILLKNFRDFIVAWRGIWKTEKMSLASSRLVWTHQRATMWLGALSVCSSY